MHSQRPSGATVEGVRVVHIASRLSFLGGVVTRRLAAYNEGQNLKSHRVANIKMQVQRFTLIK